MLKKRRMPGNRAKYEHNPDLKKLLLATGSSVLAEASSNAYKGDEDMLSKRSSTGDAVLKIQSKDTEMHDMHFGRPHSEEEYLFIFTQKTNVSSVKEFLTKALALADSKEGGCEWTETYLDLDCTPVECSSSLRLPDLKQWTEDAGYEKEPVTVVIEPIISCSDLGPQEWNERTSIIETETDYIFYNWYTTA